ncbi:MAG: GGDEF domain-containing protein [Bacilli bacterium]|nr:GGDEF domain-containing protein [Bacilli bacterium]MBN2876269.1 GGDEF domain-containing protein [Bacilli bacterium]
MDYLVQFQMNIFTVVILIILFVTIKRKAEVNGFGQQILKLAVVVSAIAILVEPLTWILDNTQFFGSFVLEYGTNFLLIILGPIIGGLMLTYVDYYIFKDLSRIKKKYFYMHVAAGTLIMLVVNVFFPIYFSVDQASNTYQQGDFMWVQYVVIGLMYLYMLYFLMINRRKIFQHVVRIFIFFFALPIIGMIVQMINVNLLFAWNSIALALIVCYIFLESTSGARDYLTQLFSRQSSEAYIHKLIEQKVPFTFVMIDLDKFKHINDEYGHLRGDNILVSFRRILEKAFSPNKLVSRLAGDEFIIVVENVFNKNETITRIYDLLAASDDEVLQKMTFSMGVKPYESGLSMDDLYYAVDRKMYANKER